jgi:hypothetical protein
VHPHGIQKLGGPGSTNFAWNPDAMLFVDYSMGTFHRGDTVQFDVYDKTTNQIISRDIWPHTEKKTHDVQWFYHYFLNHRGA